jgi:hypothetical protein
MKKADALKAMEDGKKVSHITFTKDEFIYMENGLIHDENGYLWGNKFCEAWKIRSGGNWSSGWKII